MKEPLLPDRHPERDFFILDIFDSIPVKADRHTMEHPFFTLSTKPDLRDLEYKKDGISIKITPHARLGLPTMMDKDILLYVGSLLMREINEGRLPSKTVRFSCHDLLITTNRETSGEGYKLLKNAFDRITGALINTDIKTKEIKQYSGFHILDKFTIIETSHKKRRMVRVQVTVSDWFYNALLGREVLTINRAYFRLRKSLERRLYELARKHCGQQAEWGISLENLHAKCGAVSPLKNFRYQIKDIIRTDHLPDYTLSLDDSDMARFTHRGEIVRQSLAQAAAALDTEQAEGRGYVPVPAISEAAYRQGAELVEASGTGWDYCDILHQYDAARASGDFTPKNHNAAFLGFVKKKVRQRA